ncbi:MAG TPA: biotin--[acetyl-CoA-carboxylase] ligase [Armatimonadota bacterium]|nr:biotin--[acetyl-CoA-carboxylase] ligase [Armatimonadota bacterium]
MNFAIHRFDSVASTNDVALQMADAPEGTVIIAGEQTSGKGRRGRKWSSPPGEGLYLSIVLHPSLPYDKLWQMAFVVSLAACEAIREVSGLDARIKQPNDILINARKVCGILIETRGHGDAGTRGFVVIGIGINVNNQSFPPDLNATSLALELGRTFSMPDMENALLRCLDARYEQFLTDGFQPILELWKALDCTVGRQTTDHMFEGTGLEVAENGDLQIQSGRDASVAE